MHSCEELTDDAYKSGELRVFTSKLKTTVSLIRAVRFINYILVRSKTWARVGVIFL